MVIKELLNTNPHPKCYTAGMKCLNSVSKPEVPEVSDCCLPCLPKHCTDNEKVYCNDQTGLEAYKELETDLITFKLQKQGGSEIILDGTTYSTITQSGLRCYILIDWALVKAALGCGKYTVKICYNILQVEYTEECNFILMECNPCDELGLVKVEYWITGKIKDGREYCDDYFSFRVPGSLVMLDPLDEIETYKNKNRIVRQYSSGVYERWGLNTYFTTEQQGKRILKELAHASKVRLTAGLNEKSPNIYLVREQGISINNPAGSNKCFFNLTFVEQEQTNLNNYCKPCE